MWLQSRGVHSGYDLPPPSAAGEVSRAAAVVVPRLRGPHQSLRLGEQKWALQDPPEDWLPSRAPGDYYIITSFHQDTQSTVCFDGATSDDFPVSSGVKQGCILAPTLFGIFFSMLLRYAFADCPEDVYVRMRSDGKLFNIARLRAKTKVYEVLIRGLLLADEAVLTSHSEQGLQHLVDKLFHTCKEFGLTVSLRKRLTVDILAQGAESPPVITIDNMVLKVVDTFTYLGSTVSSSPSVDAPGLPKQLLSWPNSASECGTMAG